MASTTPTNVDSSIREVWAKGVLREHLIAGFFGKFVGPEGSSAAIVQKTELLDKPGDLIHIQTTVPLSGAGVTGDTATLVGNEENLTTAEILVQPQFYRHGVRWYRRANKKSIVALRDEAKLRLAEWGEEKMDDLRFAQFASITDADVPGAAVGRYAANEYVPVGTVDGADAGSTIDKADILAANKLTVVDLQTIKLRLVNQKAKPLKTAGGEPVYAMVCHPNALFDIKRDSEYRDWVKDAERRGPDNPFFTGATAMVDGMVLYEHPNVPTYTSQAGIKSAVNIAFGANAFVEGVDENPSWDEDSFDYGNEFGIAYKFAFQPRRALKLSSLLVYSAAVDK
jgi:N4-gp56 family major capsid protein